MSWLSPPFPWFWARALRDGGTASVEGISTSRSEFEADAKDAVGAVGAKGTNLIVMVDAAGVVVGYTYLGLLPSVALDVTDVRRTGEVIVTVSDWYYGDYIDLVRINGITVNLPDNTNKPNDSDSEPDPWVHPTTHANHEVVVNSKGSAKFTVVVDRDTRLGEMQVDLAARSPTGSRAAPQPGHPHADGPGRILPPDPGLRPLRSPNR